MPCKCLLVLAGIVALPFWAQAGSPAPSVAPRVAAGPFTDEKLTVDAVPTVQDINDFRKLVSGTDPGEDEKAAKLLADQKLRTDLMKKVGAWLAYRLTWPEIQEARDPNLGIREAMEGVLGNPAVNYYGAFMAFSVMSKWPAEDATLQPKYNRQRAYLAEFRVVMTPILQEVMKNRLIARVNTVRIMNKFAELGQEEMADELVKILESPQEEDAVRVWALHGLQDYFAWQFKDPKELSPQEIKLRDPKDPNYAKRKTRLENCGLALCRWLDGRCAARPETLGNMSEPEVAALRYLRREGIRALGASRRALIVDTKDRRDGPAAQILLRVMLNDNVAPPAFPSEQVEAAYGILEMKPGLSPSYQPEFAMYQVARFIAYLGPAPVDAATKGSDLWKYWVIRLQAGWADLKTELKTNKALADQLEVLSQQVDPVLSKMFTQGQASAEARELGTYLGGNPPKAKALYNPPLN